MSEVEPHNAHAGQGSVLLDIGGDVGALVVSMPVDMVGVEIEIRPLKLHQQQAGDHSHPGGQHHQHVAVVGRPTANGIAYTAVFPELLEGSYLLYEKLGGSIHLNATVTGGSVQHATWPRDRTPRET